jgi:diguanylate cyclase (GGDEF)-like protein
MRSIKSLLPVIILVVGSIYIFRNFDQLPESVIRGTVFLPYLLALLLTGLCIHFNRSTVFFYVLLLLITTLVLRSGQTESALSFAVICTVIPVLLLILSLFPDRGIISINALPAHMLVALVFLVALFISRTTPEWANHFLLNDWLPEKYFDWTSMSQTAIFVCFCAVISMLLAFLLRPGPQTAAGLGVLLLLTIILYLGEDKNSLQVISSGALLICFYAVIQESWRMAYLDELTGLPGRRALREKFQQVNGIYSVAMLDVDHFKKFNDRYGHDIGDAVLRMIAAKLKKVDSGGIPYRYGGEEFSIVFTGKNKKESRVSLENLREVIATTKFVVNRANRRNRDKKASPKKKKTVQVTVSIGIADSTKNPASPWDVLKLADKALYRAKKKGRNCVAL